MSFPAINDMLFQLANLAERTGCAILLIRHLTSRQAADPHIQDAGHPGLTALAPNILRLVKHPDDDQQRLLVSIKHILSSTPSILAFQLTTSPTETLLMHCLGETPPAILSHSQPNIASVQRQAILQLLQNSTLPLTPTEVAQRTNLSYDSVRLLLGRMVEAHEISHPARGYYIAHQHHSLDTINNQPSPTTNTINTTDTTTLDPYQLATQNEKSPPPLP